MSVLGTVVVGFDGSPSSVDALALGARLAAADGAEVVAAFVYRADPVAFGDEGEFQAWQREIALRELGAARTLQPSAELSAIRSRSVVRGLHELASSRDAGLVVVGSTHRGPLGRIVPGSTGQRLLEGAPCPVAVAPRGWAGAPSGSLAPVVAGYDGEPDSAAAVRWAASMAGVLEAPLRIVSVVEPMPLIPADPITFVRPEAVEEALREAHRALHGSLASELETLAGSLTADPPPASVTTDVVDGHPADQLVAHVPEEGGLLVVGSRGYGPLGAVFMGSCAAEVLREATSPTIVVPRSA